MTTQRRSSQQPMVTYQRGQKVRSLALLLLSSLCLSAIGKNATAYPFPPTQQTYQHPQASHLAHQSMEMLSIEAQVWQQINQHRQRYNLPPLHVDERLTQAARAYSKQMAEHNFYGHTGLNGQTFRQRVEARGVRAKLVGENLVRFSERPNPSQVAVQSWMSSPGHRDNILMSQMTKTGIGIWKHQGQYYFTQLFVEPKTETTTQVSHIPSN